MRTTGSESNLVKCIQIFNFTIKVANKKNSHMGLEELKFYLFSQNSPQTKPPNAICLNRNIFIFYFF